jgi:hypothetical protein
VFSPWIIKGVVMKIEVIKARLNGKDLEPGEVIDIDDQLALRWIQKGHAKFPKEKTTGLGSENDFVKMSKKKLLSLAKEMNVDIPDPKNAKKEDIIALIEISKAIEDGNDEATGEEHEKSGQDKEKAQA